MIILDTDCLSLFDREKHLESSVLRANLAKFSPADIYTTIITFEEQMRGWLTFLARFRNVEEQVFAYQRLHQFLDNFRKINVIQFDEKAVAVFRELKSQKIRVGTMDLKIASITIARQKAKVKRQKAKVETKFLSFHFCLLPFTFCLTT